MHSSNNKDISPDQLKKSLHSMILIRHFEQKCAQLYGMTKIRGFCHLYIGQEAIISAIDLIRDKQDAVITAYRDHGHALLCDIKSKHVLAELMGKVTGSSKGKGGSMHIFNKSSAFYGGHGIVGAQVSLGTGIAFKYKYCNQNNVCYTFFGDGAANQGQVYESFNMATRWSLPVAYIIENNGYAISTPIERVSLSKDLYKRGKGFDMPCYQVDGMKIDQLYTHFTKVANDIKNGKGPSLTEVITYRYKGHSMSDAAQYRSKAELEAHKQKDPIEYAKQLMLDKKYITQDEIKIIYDSVKKEITEAVEFAQSSSFPNKELLTQDVYI